ncbi:MAG: holo-[acyl-carrier-protein] synthase [Acidobacteria bacterium]|nr:holo-[acyl-carrier-protein] synthase [Acidobacteriota bacterium]
MIVGIGVDLEEVERIGESIAKFGERFLEKIFTPTEIAFCQGKANSKERFAARFAAKEAAFKALQASWEGGLRWQDFELIAQPGGAPRLELHGEAARLAAAREVSRVHVSFSHTKAHVTAIVIAEKD